MDSYTAGTVFYPVLEGAPLGLLTGDHLTYAIERPDNTEASPASSLQIVEQSPGFYVATRTVPSVAGPYFHVWHDSVNNISAGDEFLVVSYTDPTSDLVYTTIDAFRNYRSGYPGVGDEVVMQALRDSENDIDLLFAGRRVNLDTGRRFQIERMIAFQIEALSKATCAQAGWRIDKGPAWFDDGEIVIQGPDYTIDRSKMKGSAGIISPRTIQELRLGGLLRTGGRANA